MNWAEKKHTLVANLPSKRRLAIVVGQPYLLNWQASCLSQLNQSSDFDCICVAEKSIESSCGLFQSLLHRFRPSNSLSPAGLSAQHMLESVEASTSSLHERLQKYSPDIILYLGCGNLDHALLNIASEGVWSFRVNGRSGIAPRSLSWIARLINQRSLIVQLEETSRENKTNPRIVKNGCFRVRPHRILNSVETMLSLISDWPSCCNDTLQATDPMPDVDSNAASIGPEWFQLVRMLTRFSVRGVKRLFEYEQWSIGFVDHPVQWFLDGNKIDNVRWLDSPGNPSFVADPFGLVHNDKTYVFHERLDEGSRHGVIAWYEVGDESSTATVSTDIISRDAHLSYPYLLKHNGKQYCIPESVAAGEIAIYEAEDFPHRWNKVGTLLSDTSLYDPTVFQHDGRWWLFGAGHEDGGQLTLHVWYSDDLFGPWKEHANNPVKIDVRSARPAGTPFFHEGHWHRPAQDCSKTYGGRAVINRITRLTPTEFSEEIVATVNPRTQDYFGSGLHTIASAGSRTLIDGKRISYSLAGLTGRFRKAFS